MTIIILAEKPDACARIAQALAEKGLKKKTSKYDVDYYEFLRNGKKHIAVAAVGHLFNLKQKGSGWDYPVFNLEWVPSFRARKISQFSEKYYKTIEEIAKAGSEYISACDYDNEGSLIAWNILKFICNASDAKRMKFSTLAKPDLIYSYEHMMPHLDFENIEAGLARHFLDYYYGINASRALTLAIKKESKRFSLLTAGRVQGPTLVLLAEKEKEIAKFVPKPFWQLELLLLINGKEVVALYEKDKIWDKSTAEKIFSSCKGKPAIVSDVVKKRYKQSPPVPFNVTSLQTEAYRLFGYSPRQTLNIAQSLYTGAAISYPRTSSEKLPPQINYKEILAALSKIKKYAPLCKKLFALPELKPTEGKRIDPAHESIHPTVEPPKKKLSGPEQKIYDLICRRFFSVFAKEAVRESMQIIILVNGYKFLTTGRHTIEKGWMEFYSPYAKFDEVIFPELKKDDKLKTKKLDMLSKETSPPPRYSQASIIKKMEQLGLGTRCLAGDELVKITKNGKTVDVPISKLFDDCKPLANNGHVEISLNNNICCFSLNGKSKRELPFTLISRRKLGPNEKMLKLSLADGSSIKVTEEHPICVLDRGFKFKLAKDLKASDKIISSFFYDRYEDEIKFDYFIRLCDENSCLYGDFNLRKYRLEKGLTQKQSGEKIDTVQCQISEFEKKNKIPLFLFKKINIKVMPKFLFDKSGRKINNPFPLKMNCSFARILANLVGDGSIDRKKIERENCYDFRYHNTNFNLIKKFAKDIKIIFGVEPRIVKCKPRRHMKQKYFVRLPAIIGRIIATIFPEVIDKKASKLPKELFPYFIAGLFDDEGHSYKNEGKLFISGTSFELLKETKVMLEHMGIRATLEKMSESGRKKHWSKGYKLYVRGRDNIQSFLEKIPFISSKKKQRLINVLTNKYVFYPTKESVVLKEKKILKCIQDTAKMTEQISSELNISEAVVRSSIKHLRESGYIEKIVFGNNKDIPRIIKYKASRPLSKTFYSMINEKVINSDFITKTVESVKEIPFNGFVFDLTVNKNVPNFILSNGVVVHNSTRAAILQTLYDRDYVFDKSIKVTNLGLKIADTLKKHVPDFVDEKLTRKFEKDLEKIQQNKIKKEKILNKAKKVVTKICEEFKQSESKIGKELGKAIVETQTQKSILGPCPNCGKNLKILFSPRTRKRFVGCSGYPKCKTGFPIPLVGAISVTGKICEQCNTPIIQVWRKGKRPFLLCLDPNCPKKLSWKKPNETNEEYEKRMKTLEKEGKAEGIKSKTGKKTWKIVSEKASKKK